MGKKIREISYIVGVTIIPPVLRYIAKSDGFATFARFIGIQDDIIKIIQETCSLADLLITEAVLITTCLIYKRRVAKRDKQVSYLMRQLKEFCIDMVKQMVDKPYMDLNIRLYIPKRRFRDRIISKFKTDMPVVFKQVNIEHFSVQNIPDELTFEVSSNPQGLVGFAYATRLPVYVDNMRIRAGEFNMSDYQVALMNNVAFQVCYPVVNKHGVCAILSFESSVECEEIKHKQFFDLLNSFSTQFYHNMKYIIK